MFLIEDNMNKDQKRLKFIQQQCKNANIPFTRFHAINGNKLNLQKLQENNNKLPRTIRKTTRNYTEQTTTTTKNHQIANFDWWYK